MRGHPRGVSPLRATKPHVRRDGDMVAPRLEREVSMVRHFSTTVARVTVVGLVVALRSAAFAATAATGTFGINVSVPFPYTSGTFNGMITGFDTGPFDVGGASVDLKTSLVGMSITNGQIPAINIPALASTFSFDAT